MILSDLKLMRKVKALVFSFLLGISLLLPVSPVIASQRILPDTPEAIKKELKLVYEKYLPLEKGEVFGVTLQQKKKVNPNWFAISIATVDGQIYSVGDVSVRYPIQSISKPFVFGLALKDYGSKTMLKKVGVDATGLPYNSMIASQIRPTKLQNPMVSAGAIATASLIKGKDTQVKWQRTKEMFERYIGHPVKIDEVEYREEVKYSKQTEALAHILSANNLLYSSPDETILRYLKGTSVEIDTKDLAVMGATLANWGINPFTKKRAIEGEYVQNMLSVMITSGMYDHSGGWLYLVGLPAKSGVCGGIVIISPARFAIAVFSPPLDEYGNSVRGVEVLKDLSEKWNLNIFSPNNEIWKPLDS